MSKPITTKKKNINKKILSTHKINLKEEGKEKYVESIAALIDKYLQYIILDKGIPIGIIIVIMVLVIIQDNWAGRLQTWLGWFWALIKCFFLMILYIIYCISRYLLHSIINKNDSEVTKLIKDRK